MSFTMARYATARFSVKEAREATWGVGVGLEMFLGTDQFLARPVTF